MRPAQPRRVARGLDVRATEPAIGRCGNRAHDRPVERRDQLIGQRADRSGAERDDEIAGARDADDRRHDLIQPRDDIDRHGHAAPDGRRERVDRDARNRVLAGRVDVRQHDVIGAGERRTEGVHQRRRSGKAMRLKGDDNPSPERTGGLEHRGDLGRVVSVVVDDEDAVRLAANVEPPLRAAKVPEAGRGLLEGHAQFRGDGDRGQRVLQVVPARHLQRQRPQRRPASRPDRRRVRACRFTVAVMPIGSAWMSVAVKSAPCASQAVRRHASRDARQHLRQRPDRRRTRSPSRRTAPGWRSRRTPAAGRRTRRSSRGVRGRCSSSPQSSETI